MSMIAATEPQHIAVSKSKGVAIDWKDGHRSEYSLPYLRDECPCAGCTGSHGTEPRPKSGAAAPDVPFPMFQPALKIDRVEAVGAYALRIHWNDGHNAGIYSFEHMREICPCSECGK